MPSRNPPDLLTADEQRAILTDAEQLWSDLQGNQLGGFSGPNRPFYILHHFKVVIEKYGRRDVGLTWSKNDLDALPAAPMAEGVDLDGLKGLDLIAMRDLPAYLAAAFDDAERSARVEQWVKARDAICKAAPALIAEIERLRAAPAEAELRAEVAAMREALQRIGAGGDDCSQLLLKPPVCARAHAARAALAATEEAK